MARRSPSRRRVHVYDAREQALEMRETFVNRRVQTETEFPFDWEPAMQNVGDSLAIAYSSDKWKKPKGNSGRRDWELYKHLAESRNHIFAARGIIRGDERNGGDYARYPVRGPDVVFCDVDMPDTFAVLGRFEEANVQLYTGGTDRRPTFSDDPDEGVVTLTVGRAMLGGGKMRMTKWTYKPFLFVYTAGDGVHFLVVGDELAVEKDGITG